MTQPIATGRGNPHLPLALIEAAQVGDRVAIDQLLAVSQPDIRRYARITCKVDDIDTAVQDALWLVYRRIGALRVVTSFSAWLFAIVRRECQRLARRTLRLQPIEAIENDGAFATRPVEDLRIDLVAAIQSLPEHYRVIILMRDIEELTINEIAGSTKLTREAVKARLHRARAMIREYLED